MTDVAREVGELLRALDQMTMGQPNATSVEYRLTEHLMRKDMRDAHPECAVEVSP